VTPTVSQPWRWCPTVTDGSRLLVRDFEGRLQVWDGESGVLHRELEGFRDPGVSALATFLSADGQQSRLVAGAPNGQLWVYDPEAGSVMHRLDGHTGRIRSLACIASSSAAPHHPRLVSASDDGTAKVWDGETGVMLADLRGHTGNVDIVTVWKEHTGGHDRIATAAYDGHAKVWDGEAFTLLHDLVCGDSGTIWDISAFESAEGSHRLLVALIGQRGVLMWDPEEGRLLHEAINQWHPFDHFHLFESAQGRHLLAILGDARETVVLNLYDLGEAPAPEEWIRRANKHG
jgi:WD40 repeat protein